MEIGYLGAFLMGLFGALHCVGMCGSIMGVLTFSLPEEIRKDPLQLMGYLSYYSLGRILSYTLAGTLAGAFGAGLLFRISPQYGHTILLLMATILMIAVGLYLAGWFPAFAHIEKAGAPIWRKLEPIGRKLLPVSTPWQALLYGLIWGWLPCGLVYSALFIAIGQGGMMQGGLFMLLFGTGTLPAVMATGIFAEHVMRFSRNPKLRMIAGILLIVFALTGLIINW
ncbi:MAG TPA: sulfite exporter TauE/SafE family protein [Chromatiaceae bacterium]|nr:sulfite exporter TauE/SafE family protein [Chromatiaceae bacterium]